MIRASSAYSRRRTPFRRRMTLASVPAPHIISMIWCASIIVSGYRKLAPISIARPEELLLQIGADRGADRALSAPLNVETATETGTETATEQETSDFGLGTGGGLRLELSDITTERLQCTTVASAILTLMSTLSRCRARHRLSR